MRAPAIAALGIAAYAVCLVATVPASFVAERLQRSAGGQLQIRAPGGTLWNGSAAATVATPAGPVTIERIAWHFLPARLGSARLAFAVEMAASGLSGTAEVARSPGEWEAREVQARGDASGLGAWMPLVAGWRPEGPIALTAARLAWDERELRGEGRLEWRGAAVALSQVRPLGSYRVELRGDGGPAKLTVTTIEGPLRVTAQGTFAPPSRMALAGEARAEGANAEALRPLLDLLGPRRADGAHALEWRAS